MRMLKAYKSVWLVLFLILIYSTIVVSQSLIKNSNQVKDTPVKKSVLQANTATVSAKIDEGNSSAEVKINTQVPSNQTQTSSTPGTCKVTRNGVTETVPADQVKVNEKSSGDITVKIECDNSSSSSTANGSSKTSIKNSIDLNVSTSN